MLKLHGFPVSNYYNKVKLALLEKDIPFEEVLVTPDRSAALIEKSLLGKIPFLETEQGILVESQVQVEYLEDAYPQKPLIPADPYQAAKVRELIIFMELHLELVARELYMEAFFKGQVSDEVKTRVGKLLKRNAKAFQRMVKFSPYVGGDAFTLADCAAVLHLPLVGQATKIIYGEDVLAELPVRDYVTGMADRPSLQRVNADRKAYLDSVKK
ncbi:glutathione S-transferase family protein [Lacisediminimonas sp.]|uniref:glutathione S-transferase family protein n=1 Tax=Lacisediminimonas sp. TaxID=3060582 RepID=UPI00271BD634|nr:glutathione S-transferase [Lacisediminimonas sp.]MDO8300567.1 glutathione S-transferase [Lacisediminimonas sp.]MDO9216446.1 glutathione S-transferase [Lacisediminimonas sp.]